MVEKAGANLAPLLTVAMPIFNAGHHLRLAVLSIVHQSFQNWELIICDDGSTDNAVRSLDDIDDPRIRIINDGLNKGLAARLNEAIDMAHGQYFGRMDQDDVSYPERFAKQLALLRSDSTLDVVAASAITISDVNAMTGLLPCPVSHEAICARPWQGFCFAHPTWMGKTAWFRKFKYAVPGPYFCEDQELLLRSYSKSRFGATEEILFAYRVRETRNLSRVLKTRWTFFQIQKRHFIQAGQPTYAILSGFVYLALITRDLWWEYRLKIFSSRCDQSIASTKEYSGWQKVLGGILEAD
jgi:glycosyltransferase involved in cell wall biosynthesis